MLKAGTNVTFLDQISVSQIILNSESFNMGLEYGKRTKCESRTELVRQSYEVMESNKGSL